MKTLNFIRPAKKYLLLLGLCSVAFADQFNQDTFGVDGFPELYSTPCVDQALQNRDITILSNPKLSSCPQEAKKKGSQANYVLGDLYFNQYKENLAHIDKINDNGGKAKKVNNLLLLTRAMDYLKKSDSAFAYADLGDIYSGYINNPKEGIRYYQKAIASAKLPYAYIRYADMVSKCQGVVCYSKDGDKYIKRDGIMVPVIDIAEENYNNAVNTDMKQFSNDISVATYKLSQLNNSMDVNESQESL